LQAGRSSRLLWKGNENDLEMLEIHPDVKPGTFLRNISGKWGSKCLDVASKPLPAKIRQKYHAKKENGRNMLPSALNEVFKLRGKPEQSTHNLLLKQANDRVDIFGSAPTKAVTFRSDSPKSWHSKVNHNNSKRRRQRPKSSPTYRSSSRNQIHNSTKENRFEIGEKKRRPITANIYKSTRFQKDQDEDIELLTITNSPRNYKRNGHGMSNKKKINNTVLKNKSRRPNSAVTYVRKKTSSEYNTSRNARRRKQRPETAKEKGSPRAIF
jgi:hypothetical protein